MPYCQKCGTKVAVTMAFCPECGASLKVAESGMPVHTEYYRSEKAEKQEKQEKQEKTEKQEKQEKGEQQEKYEKQQYSIIGTLVGGAILILIGFLSYLSVSGVFNVRSLWPFLLIIIGAIIILAVVVGSVMARQKSPMP